MKKKRFPAYILKLSAVIAVSVVIGVAAAWTMFFSPLSQPSIESVLAKWVAAAVIFLIAATLTFAMVSVVCLGEWLMDITDWWEQRSVQRQARRIALHRPDA